MHHNMTNRSDDNKMPEEWADMVDQVADWANEAEIPGAEDWETVARDVRDGFEQGMEAYEEASGAFEGDDGERSNKGASLAAAFVASALAITAVQF